MDDKEKLRQAILRDIPHWSVGALKEALSYIDGMVLSLDGDGFLWWWELRKDVQRELDARKVQHEDIRSNSRFLCRQQKGT